jgi:hypothetical protein
MDNKRHQKVILVKGHGSLTDLQNHLNQGWYVVHALAQHVACTHGDRYELKMEGDLIFIIEKTQ